MCSKAQTTNVCVHAACVSVSGLVADTNGVNWSDIRIHA